MSPAQVSRDGGGGGGGGGGGSGGGVNYIKEFLNFTHPRYSALEICERV